MALLTTTAGPVDFFYETVAPAVTSNRGAISFRIDAGNVGTWQNTDGTAAGWVQLLPAGGAVTWLTASTWNLLDNTAGALVLRTAAGANYLSLTTTNDAEFIDLGATPATGAPNQGVRVLSVGPIELNGIDAGTRLVLDEDFRLRPDIAANVANADANKNIAVIGTNSAAWTFATGGGVTGTTPANANDQQCLRGQTAANQGMWSTVNWSTSDSVRFKCNLRTGAAITTQVIAAGLKLSLVAGASLFDNATNADQVYLGYATDARYGAVAADWWAVVRIGAASANVDTTVVVAINTNYRVVIDVDVNRITRFYINGILRATSAALTVATNLLPFAGTETLAVAARAITVQRLCCSKVLN